MYLYSSSLLYYAFFPSFSYFSKKNNSFSRTLTKKKLGNKKDLDKQTNIFLLLKRWIKLFFVFCKRNVSYYLVQRSEHKIPFYLKNTLLFIYVLMVQSTSDIWRRRKIFFIFYKKKHRLFFTTEKLGNKKNPLYYFA